MPLILPFVGAIFGGFLYDLLVFTGPSPINTPYLGLRKVFRPDLEHQDRAIKKAEDHEG